MAEERQEELPPLYSAKDIEIAVWTRVLHRVAEMGKEGVTVTDEDYSARWGEEVRRIVAQIRERESRNREKFRRWMRLTE